MLLGQKAMVSSTCLNNQQFQQNPLDTLTKTDAFELTAKDQAVKLRPASLLVTLRYLFT